MNSKMKIVYGSILLTLMQSGCKGTQSGSEKSSAEAGAAAIPAVAVTHPISQKLDRIIRLPGELAAFQDVALYAKVQGFVESITVDRGSKVKKGQLLAQLMAPELAAQRNSALAKAAADRSQILEAESRLKGLRAKRAEAESKLASDDATYKRLKAAAITPGVIAGNELETSQKLVESDQARVQSAIEDEKAGEAHVLGLREIERAARATARVVEEMETYLRLTAPFDGIVTERNVHEGSLVGPPGSSSGLPLLRIQQVSNLRLTVYVPESEVAGISTATKVPFTVSAAPGQTFSGVVSRVAQSLDVKTRTMPVELDVANPSNNLSPGMYAEVLWPSRRNEPTLFVPPTAIAVTTERTFVVRIQNGTVEWVDVKRGATMGTMLEVFGDLKPEDLIAIRGTDELRSGTHVAVKQPTPAGK